MKRFWILLALPALAPLHGEGQASLSTPNCENLARLAVTNGSIVAAQTVAAGELKLAPAAALPPSAQTALGPQDAGGPGRRPPQTDLSKLPAICRVQGSVKPSTGNDARFEVWLPLTGWNGSSVTVTHPTSAGGMVNSEVVQGVRNGYAALLNMSPSFDDWASAAKTPDQLLDQGYRDGHAMIIAAKTILQAFYGSPVHHAYYEGCSEGGREGFSAAQHYPEDYDGIIVGGAGNQFALINAAQLFPAWTMGQHPGSFIPQRKWSMIHAAVLDACDGIDGVKDRLIEDPRQCNFKPESLLCKGEQNDTCLTAPQAEALKAIYKGLVNPRTGHVLFPGPALGGELPVFEFANPDAPMQPAYLLYKALVFGGKTNWDYRTLDFDKDLQLAYEKVGPALHTAPADLKDFIHRGGKIIIWDGWNDYNNPYYWMDYYAELQKRFGAGKLAEHVAMYFLPGVQHCGGGEGCDSFSKLDAISAWVTSGKPPAWIHSSRIEHGNIMKTHPVCRYPQVAKYKGSGDAGNEANWICADASSGYRFADK